MAVAMPIGASSVSRDRRKSRRAILPITADLGTAERAKRHGGIVVEPRTLTDGGVIVAEGARVKAECHIEALYLKGRIDHRQFQAGMIFRALWSYAAMPASVVSSYGERRGGGGGIEREIDARLQLNKAMLQARIATQRGSARPIRLTSTGEVLQPVGGEIRATKAGSAVIEAAGMDGLEYRLDDLTDGLTALADFWKIADDTPKSRTGGAGKAQYRAAA